MDEVDVILEVHNALGNLIAKYGRDVAPALFFNAIAEDAKCGPSLRTAAALARDFFAGKFEVPDNVRDEMRRIATNMAYCDCRGPCANKVFGHGVLYCLNLEERGDEPPTAVRQ